MSHVQFYVALAVPTIVILVGILLNNQRLNDLNGRFGDFNSRFNDLHKRLDDLRTEMIARIDGLGETLRAEMARNHSELLAKMVDLDNRITRLETGNSLARAHDGEKTRRFQQGPRKDTTTSRRIFLRLPLWELRLRLAGSHRQPGCTRGY